MIQISLTETNIIFKIISRYLKCFKVALRVDGVGEKRRPDWSSTTLPLALDITGRESVWSEKLAERMMT
jgi:hypothetical protein